MRVACIGECMIELREEADGRYVRGFGGDTLNTAVYLARLGVSVDYVTALGDDAWSLEMAAAWRKEGVGTELVLHCNGQMSGLYVIQTDATGERRFLYWRDSAAARRLFALPETDQVIEALGDYGLLYYSGISLSLYDKSGRSRLFDAFAQAQARGAMIAFDTNFRPHGWSDRLTAQIAFRYAITQADMVFASLEDLELLYGKTWENELLQVASSSELILKLREPACRVHLHGQPPMLVKAPPVPQVVDTTAAGDSFAAAYIAARLDGLPPVAAAAEGHRLAGAVVGHPGAIIPRTV